MIDLHLFLGRPLRTNALTVGSSSGPEKCDTICTYSLSEMTPDMVHVGSVPEAQMTDKVEWVQRIINSELSGSSEAETLRSLTKACSNAMKQYRRTRVGASNEAVGRAKALLDGNDAFKRGERIYNGSIPAHPLFNAEQSQDLADFKHYIEDVRSRGEFLRTMSTYRPKETVFEAFTTRGNRDAGYHGSWAKGQSGAKVSKAESGTALEAVKGMRRQMKIVRDRGASLVVAGKVESVRADVLGDVDVAPSSDRSHVPSHGECTSQGDPGAAITKRKVSRAERRRFKKPLAHHESHDSPLHFGIAGTPTKRKRGADFRDSTCFAAHEASSGHQVEMSRQTGSLSYRGGLIGGIRLSEALLDVVDDESDALVRQQRMVRWDRSKRKYVHTTIGSELNGESKTMKRRIESGSLKKDHKLGELYEKWQRKTNRSIGRSGVFDDGNEPPPDQGKVGQRSSTPSGRFSELKSVASIKKDRAWKQNMWIKNMKKVDRKAHEGGDKRNRR
jgi:DBP10CT (NUC160) domain